jgi:hypothetical protein
MNKRHKATCNSGLAKYPDGVPVGICADRNCDCGVEASSEIAGKSMNKSEIAERFEKLAEFYDGESMRNCVHRGEEIAKMLRQVLGERAIAESQAPQSELNQRESTTRLSNEMNALGGIWANLGTTWIPVEEKLPSEGEMVLTFHADSEIWNVEKYPHSVARGFHPDEPTMWFDAPVSHWMPLPSPPNVSQERYQCRGCGEEYAVGVKCDLCELGDGEPSPPPDWPKKVAEQLVRLVESWQTISEEDAPEIEAVIRSGAAQEVSLSASEIRSDDPPPSCHVCGEIMVKWKCLKCGATTGCSDEEVSPPSPEQFYEQEWITPVEDGVAAPLEPSQFTAEDFHNSREWVQHQPQSDRECLTEDGYWLAFAEMYAAAVSKNSEERMQRTIDLLDSELGESVAETKAAEARILELEKEIAALRETK